MAATAAAAVTLTAGSASPVARTVNSAPKHTTSHAAELTSYAVPDHQLHVFRAHVALERVEHIATEAHIAAKRAAAHRAAVRAAEARQAAANAAANAAAAKAAAARKAASAPAAVTPSGGPQQIALAMLGSFGWSSSQMSCLIPLWNRESGWNPSASNPTSGAFGIPQALPGSKMASAGADWATNPATQIKWGLGYIQSVYGSPCAAWAHSESVGWY